MRNRAQGRIQMGSKSGINIETRETTVEQSKKFPDLIGPTNRSQSH